MHPARTAVVRRVLTGVGEAGCEVDAVSIVPRVVSRLSGLIGG